MGVNKIFQVIMSCWLTASLTEGVFIFPNVDFIEDFVTSHDLTGTILHAPNGTSLAELVYYRRHFRQFAMSVFKPSPKLISIPMRISRDLQIVVDFNASYGHLQHQFEIRPHTDTDYWLVDVTGVPRSEWELRMNQVYTFERDTEDTQSGAINMWEVYKIRPDHNITALLYGNWTKSQGIQLHSQEELWERRKDLKGLEFRVATLKSSPYITYLEQNEDETSLVMKGMFADVFHSLQDIMNFTYILTTPPDGEWGGKLADETWSGMVGMLERKEIDMASTDFTVTHERSEVMTFAEPITQIYHSMFIKNPQGTPNYTAYSEPLHWMSWVAVAIFIVMTPPILFMAVNLGLGDNESREFTLGKSYVFTASVMTFARPWDISPHSLKARVAFFSLLLGGTFVFWHWEAMLISYLATRVIVLPFTSLEELLSNTDFKITLTPGSSYADSFQYSNNPLWQQAWQERIAPEIDTYPKGEGHADKIMAEADFAMYDNFFAVRTYSSYSDCEIIAIPQKYDFKPYAYGFQKDSPYLGPFNFYLKQLRERGATKNILEKYESRPQVCPDYSGKPLGFDNCFTAFLCLIFGVTMGLLCLAVEHLLPAIQDLTGFNLAVVLQSYGRLKPRDILVQNGSEEVFLIEQEPVDRHLLRGLIRDKNIQIHYLQKELEALKTSLSGLQWPKHGIRQRLSRKMYDNDQS